MSATLFFLAVLIGLLLVPLLAMLLRRSLPVRPGREVTVEPIVFGGSQKARRSPRHAVLLHRGLMGSLFMALIALSLVPAAAALRELGTALVPAALAFALPTLLVTLHARRRSRDE
jgi:hypothetical protein